MSKKELRYAVTTLLLLGVSISVFLGNVVPLVIAVGLILLIVPAVAQEKKQGQTSTPAKKTKPKTPRPVEVPVKAQPKPKRSAPGASPVAASVAKRLRGFAAFFDHAASGSFFFMSPVGIVRKTESQEIIGPGEFRFHRGGLSIVFRNQNSPQAKPRQIRKQWRDVLGWSGEGEYRLYFDDLTSVLFVPLGPEDELTLSALWEIMLEVTRPPYWNNGPRHADSLVTLLRQVARFLDENADRVSAKGKIDWSGLELDLRFVEETPERFSDIPSEGAPFLDGVLRKRLGEGGFGSVFVSESADTPGQFMAVKLMKPPKDVDPWSDAFLRRAKQFFDEAVLSSRVVGCPYIASSARFGLEPWPWISYPRLNGTSIAAIRNVGRTDPKDWWNLAHDLVSALFFVHREGIVHRDVHAGNVMLVEDRAVLLDFGLSQVADHAQLKNRLAYWPTAAPEALVAERAEDITAASDVFSAGMVLYQALTGRSPWPDASSRDEQYSNILQARADLSALTGPAKEILESMLRRSPEKRPTAEDLLWAIAPYVDMEQKTRAIEESGKSSQEARSTEAALKQGFPYPDPPAITGPLTSWKVIDDHIAWIINEVRPRFFSVDIVTTGKPKKLYFQAITDGEGWVFEAMSERFSDQAYAEAQRQNFLLLDWAAPSDSSPNYQRQGDEHAPEVMSQDFSDAVEFCYGLTLRDIKKVSFSIQGSNMYTLEVAR